MRRIVDRWWLVALALLAGVVGLTAAVFLVEADSRSAQQRVAQREAVVELRVSVDDVLAREVALARVLGVLRSPVGHRWAVFADSVTSQPLTFSAGFVSPVSEGDRAVFERGRGLKLVESLTQGAFRAAARRPEHFVLTHYVQKSPGAPPLGLDLGANPLRRMLLLQAASSGRQVATPPLRFLERGGKRGVIVYDAVRDSRGRLLGWATAAYEANHLAATVSADTPGLRLTVRDGSSTLVSSPGALAGSPGFVDVAGRRWSVWASVPGAGVGPVPWLVLGLGLSLTLAVVLVLRQAITRERYATARVERHVEVERERQAELDCERTALADAQAIARIGSWSWEPASDTVDWSVQMYRIFDRDPGPVTSEDLFAYMHHADRDRIAQGYALALGAGDGFDLDYRIVTRDGGVRFLHAIGQRDGEGRYVGTTQDVSQLRRAEDALTEAERANRTLAMIVTQSKDAIIAKTLPEGVITAWNRGAEQVYGYAASEIVGRPASVLVPAERKGEELEIMHRLLAGDPVAQYETTRVRKDGSVIEVSLTVSPIHEPDGRILTASAITRDITEHKQGERRVAEAARFFDLSRDLFCTVSFDGTLVQANDSWEAILGWSAEELRSRPFVDFVHPDDREATEAVAAVLAIGANVIDFENRCETKSGGWRRLEWAAVRVPELQLIYATGRDVTERIEAEAARWEAEERFRSAFDGTPIGMALLSLDGTWLRVNSSLCDIVGYSDRELRKLTFQDITHPDDLDADLELLRQMLDGEIRTYQMHKRYTHRNGSDVWINQSGSLVSDADGAPAYFVAQIEDITARRTMESDLAAARDQALEASRLKSEFLANMSHEIRTPLNGVLGMTSLLLGSELGVEQREYAETVLASGEGLLVLLDDILNLSKIEAGQLDLESIDFDLRLLLEDVAALLSLSAHKKGLELACRLPVEMPKTIRGDPGRLRQIVTNLIGNALKFTASGEVLLEVTIEDQDDGAATVRFQVIDTGIGIAPEDQAGLFELFSQVDASTTRRFGGTGLGLAISRQLVELMGGEIGIHSEPGQGSTFWFTLPLKRGERAAAAAPQGGLAGLRMLVVDDNATNRAIVTRFLRFWGVRSDAVDGAAQADQALAASVADGDPFDVTLLDLRMPEVDGFALARKIAADSTLAPMKMVLLSSSGLGGESVQAREAGIAGYLMKPVRQSQLYDCLISVMDGSRSVEAQNATPLARPGGTRREACGRVLVAEDNAVNQRVAEVMLHKLGYQVDVVADGAQAVKAASVTVYQAILMDCQMPVLDGYEATAEIRRLHGGSSRIPIIAVTASAMKSDEQHCLAAGMDDYITKPVSRETLAAVLARWVPDGSVPARVPHSIAPVPDTAAHPGQPADALTAALDAQIVGRLERLGEATGEDVLGELTELFLADADIRVHALRHAIDTHDAVGAERLAHGLSGASAILGATALTRLCATLEKDCAAGGLVDGQAQFDALEAELERVRWALDSRTPTP